MLAQTRRAVDAGVPRRRVRAGRRAAIRNRASGAGRPERAPVRAPRAPGSAGNRADLVLQGRPVRISEYREREGLLVLVAPHGPRPEPGASVLPWKAQLDRERLGLPLRLAERGREQPPAGDVQRLAQVGMPLDVLVEHQGDGSATLASSINHGIHATRARAATGNLPRPANVTGRQLTGTGPSASLRPRSGTSQSGPDREPGRE
jgi:hypothetical protein